MEPLTTEGYGYGEILATAITTAVVTSCFATVRIVARACIMRVWDISDWVFLSAQISFVGLAVAVICGAVVGSTPYNVITLPQISNLLKAWIASELMYTVCTALLRTSIGLLLIRICGPFHRGSVLAIWGVITINAIASIFIFFFSIFECNPASFFWEAVLGSKGTCIPGQVYQNAITVTATIGTVTDLFLGSLPMFLFWNLKMERKIKLSVFILLSLGLIAGVISAVRIGVVRAAGFTLTGKFFAKTTNVAILSLIEPAIGLCCASACTFRPIFRHWDNKSRMGAGNLELGTVSSNGSSMNNWYKKVNDAKSGTPCELCEPRSVFTP